MSGEFISVPNEGKCILNALGMLQMHEMLQMLQKQNFPHQ